MVIVGPCLRCTDSQAYQKGIVKKMGTQPTKGKVHDNHVIYAYIAQAFEQPEMSTKMQGPRFHVKNKTTWMFVLQKTGKRLF